MPTDDDYGRRERLLLHQHPTAQYRPPSTSPVPGSNSANSRTSGIQVENTNPTDCYHKHSEIRSSSSASLPNQERYQDQRSQTNDHGSRDRFEKSNENINEAHSSEPRSIQPNCDQYGIVQNQERFQSTNHQYSGRSSCQTISQNILADRYSRYSESTSIHNQQSSGSVSERYGHTDSGLVSSANEYANTSILASASGNPFSPDTFPSPPSPAPANDRFVPPPPLSPCPSEKYSSSQSLACYPPTDRVLPSSSPSPRDRFGTAPTSPIPSGKDRFSSSERLLVSSASIHDTKDQQRYTASSTEQLLASPVLGNLQSDRCLYATGKDSTTSKFGISSERLVSSSPIHAPVPERFTGKSSDRYMVESPIHERYQTSSSHRDRFASISSVTERFLSSSPNPEGAHQRYSSSERILSCSGASDQSRRYSSSERSGDGSCQKYGERSSSSPVPADFTSRFTGFQDVGQRFVISNERFSDLSMQRYGQSRSTDRYLATERYLATNSPAHDGKMVSDSNRHSSSSTDRLLASSSPSSSETSRYNPTYGTSIQSTTDRYSMSPTPDGNTGHRSYSQSSTKGNEKYLQVSKSAQNYGNDRYQLSNQSEQFERSTQDRYSIERYTSSINSGGGNDRFQSSSSERYHSSAERYSPARTNSDKYLSLPKPKERYPTGRIATSCTSITGGSSERNYGSGNGTYVPPTAHTPVERYVPQPPPEVLYPDRYVDRYVPPSAHTPADRYVPVTDPGDPYMRRDLGFHHHYRLPPPGFAYHQTHFRLRGFAYPSPGRLGGSPGSSSSSSSTSAQRDSFSTSPLLRPKVRASVIDYNANPSSSSSSSRHVCGTNTTPCCSEVTSGQRGCCQTIRRSLPPGALPSIPTQSAHSSWQPSPSSGTTGTSTISSSGPDGENEQNIGMYAVEGASTETSTVTPVDSSPSLPQNTISSSGTVTSTGTTPNITRSMSAPTGQRPLPPVTSTNSATMGQRSRLRRNPSRTDVIRNYIKRETAIFFGIDEESENSERQRWLERRRRMACRRYGPLLPEHKPPDPDITRDVPDTMELPESVTLRRWQQPLQRKDSVARMTLSGLHYVVETLTRPRPKERPETRSKSRSFPPGTLSTSTRADESSLTQETRVEEEDSFFERPPAPPAPPSSLLPQQQQSHVQVEQSSSSTSTTKEDGVTNAAAEFHEAAPATERDTSEELLRFSFQTDERSSIDGQNRRPRSITRDHYISRTRQEYANSDIEVHPIEGVTLRKEIGGKRISPATIDRIFDNSNRRLYGMGIVGRFFGRSFRKSVAHKPDVRKQLDDFEDHRPYFTYWITTVQILILIISLACYGFGPIGMGLTQKSGLVLVTSLSLQQVDYQEPSNLWIGPRAADLIHLGAKFAPCMRRDIKILKEIDMWRERERDTACCIRNDDSGCVQSSKADCSIRGLRSTMTNTISTWKKWGPGDNGPGGRISGSVCGLDPKFCDAPASIAPYEWPDDITKWPICRKTNPFSQRFSGNFNQDGNSNFPVGRYKDKMAEHMVCEVIGHPCCIGIHGMCRITTKEYCDFVHGYFHDEASLCSQVECLHDVCGMVPFLHPEWPDQFYRLFTTIFLHAGVLHLAITLFVQYFLMRDLEKLTGSLRIALIYFIGAFAGNLASAIFIPYRAEVGPAGAHFALLATLIVEILHCWPMLKYPRRALFKLIIILVVLLMLGVLPWVDNYAHLFGFIFGFLAAYAFMPFISFGHYDRRRKVLLIWICTILIVGLFTLLLALFYNIPVYECEICKLFNCIPFTRDFCASQNINFKREESV
ncbi:inactive rhomboid protein 1 isoform X2 [Leptopilina boulardi]|uniref:inactive rhomboid protein 1 isoform X2 n=1 Tax=Leptopilina boulardi TaxID=63433 RepID=UPI0021F65D87|nr:inactive rhomboid protein 1 isoform X2 [Leptopilina boulardi]